LTCAALSFKGLHISCAGGYDQGSFLVQYSFSKHLDVYDGISNSQASGGVSGYINGDRTSDWVRLKF
jgi:hypothetical protein